MSAEAICDGCGKRAPMSNYYGSWHKPQTWFERTPPDGSTITACCRPCIEKIEQKRKDDGKDSNPVVIPL